jgi:hypothetical protein
MTTTIDGSLSALMMNNIMKPVANARDWLSQFTSILTRNAMIKYGFEKAFDECESKTSILSIKTEDNDMFGLSHKVSVVSLDKIMHLLTYLDGTDKGNRVNIMEMMLTDCGPQQRIVVNVLCDLKKITDNKISSPSNSFVFIDYFSKESGNHGEQCPCC